jgi:hypothetical protein
VDENILARLALDEAETLGCIKPLHCTFFFHYKTSLKKSQPIQFFVAHPLTQKQGFRSSYREALRINANKDKHQKNDQLCK